MSMSVQVGVRLPELLYERLVVHTQRANASKTEVMIAALAQYLGAVEDVPLSQRVAELEKRLAALETQGN